MIPSNRTIEQLIERRISYAMNDALLDKPGACDRVAGWCVVLDEYRKECARLANKRGDA